MESEDVSESSGNLLNCYGILLTVFQSGKERIDKISFDDTSVLDALDVSMNSVVDVHSNTN